MDDDDACTSTNCHACCDTNHHCLQHLHPSMPLPMPTPPSPTVAVPSTSMPWPLPLPPVAHPLTGMAQVPPIQAPGPLPVTLFLLTHLRLCHTSAVPHITTIVPPDLPLLIGHLSSTKSCHCSTPLSSPAEGKFTMTIELPASAGDPDEASDRVFPFTICSEGVTLLHSLTHNFCSFITFLQNVQLVYQICVCTGKRGFWF